jgi:hypothetical protein
MSLTQIQELPVPAMFVDRRKQLQLLVPREEVAQLVIPGRFERVHGSTAKSSVPNTYKCVDWKILLILGILQNRYEQRVLFVNERLRQNTLIPRSELTKLFVPGNWERVRAQNVTLSDTQYLAHENLDWEVLVKLGVIRPGVIATSVTEKAFTVVPAVQRRWYVTPQTWSFNDVTDWARLDEAGYAYITLAHLMETCQVVEKWWVPFAKPVVEIRRFLAILGIQKPV